MRNTRYYRSQRVVKPNPGIVRLNDLRNDQRIIAYTIIFPSESSQLAICSHARQQQIREFKKGFKGKLRVMNQQAISHLQILQLANKRTWKQKRKKIRLVPRRRIFYNNGTSLRKLNEPSPRELPKIRHPILRSGNGIRLELTSGRSIGHLFSLL